MSQGSFESIWNNYQGIFKVQSQPNRCPLAQQLYEFASEHLSELLQFPSHMKTNQGKLLLLDKYMQLRAIASRPHRFNMSPRSQHICLFHIFEEWYQTLLSVEIKLTPPQLGTPPPPLPLPPPPEPTQYDGLILGRIVEKGE